MINVDEVKKKINEIKCINYRETEFDTVFEKIQELMKGYKTIPFTGFHQYIYRARRNKKNKEDLEIYNNVSELWRRDNGCIREFGRANWPGYSVFYGSDNLKVAIWEKNPKLGDWFTVMRCRNLGFSQVSLVGFGFSDEAIFIDRSGRKITWGEFRANKLNLSKEDGEINGLVNNFLNDVFRDKEKNIQKWDDDRYKITAAIAKIWLDNPLKESKKLDGICYPTIKENLYFSNYAFSKESADKFLEGDSFFLFEICKGEPYGRFALKLVDYAMGIEADGRIQWQNIIMK